MADVRLDSGSGVRKVKNRQKVTDNDEYGRQWCTQDFRMGVEVPQVPRGGATVLLVTPLVHCVVCLSVCL